MQSVPEDLRRLLGPDEALQYHIRQKVYHPRMDIDSVAITNERVILLRSGGLPVKNDNVDYSYKDISEVTVSKGLFRSTVTCELRFGGDPLALTDLPNSEAREVYGLIQENIVASTPPTATPVGFSAASCRKCSSSLVPGQRFCGNCGVPV